MTASPLKNKGRLQKVMRGVRLTPPAQVGNTDIGTGSLIPREEKTAGLIRNEIIHSSTGPGIEIVRDRFTFGA